MKSTKAIIGLLSAILSVAMVIGGIVWKASGTLTHMQDRLEQSQRDQTALVEKQKAQEQKIEELQSNLTKTWWMMARMQGDSSRIPAALGAN